MRLERPPGGLNVRSSAGAESTQEGLVERFDDFFRVVGFRRGVTTGSNSSARRLRRVPRSTMAST
jgi:hypothetical protein